MQRNRSFRETPSIAQQAAVAHGLAGESIDHLPAEPEVKKASDKQMSFVNSLLGEVEITDEQRAEANRQMSAGLTSKQASAWIARLLELKKTAPKKAEAKSFSPLPDVPAGRYAVKDDEGNWSFYKVDRPEQGKWAGRTFVKRLVASGGFGDDLSEQRLSFQVTKTILEKIVAMGIQESMTRYGHELGECGSCGRTLTDEVSIARGIGPVCAGKMGW